MKTVPANLQKVREKMSFIAYFYYFVYIPVLRIGKNVPLD